MAAPPHPALRLEQREQGVYVLWMDDPEESQNTLKLDLLDAFEQVLTRLEGDTEARALVFISGKPDSFLAGANLQMLREVDSEARGSELSRLSQGLQRRIARLRLATVAAIHGPCLGGGLELALAFDARIASHDRRTRLGLPEVQLGLLPGGGGTQRLIRLIDIQRALDMLLSGRQLDSHQARGAGLVDEVVAPAILLAAALELAQERARGRERPRPRRWRDWRRWRHWALTRTPPGRGLLLRQARAQVMNKTRGLYPAPLRILEVVRTGLERGFDAGCRAEAQAFGDLVMSPQSRELVNLFLATTESKKDPGADGEAQARPPAKIGMLGGGLMGGGISYVSVLNAGVQVRLKDRDEAGVARGLAYVDRLLRKRVARKRMSALEHARTLARLSGTTDFSGLHDASLVIEAVFEDLGLKQEMLARIEAVGPEEVIFASNTSALPITEIATASRHPHTVIGMHYFSPVEKMPLLEIIVTEHTAPWVTRTCVEFGRRQGKTVIVVNDGVGFYTTRILVPFMLEAMTLVIEGVAVEAIDSALLDFGFPVGPVALLDEVGIDVAEKVALTAAQAFGERIAVPPALTRLGEDGRLGRKNGRGFYRYDGSAKGDRAVDASVYALLGAAPRRNMGSADIVARCALAMVNEAAHCLDDGVLRSPRDGDIGAVFGLGFPPFRGGPFRYADSEGAGPLVAQLERLGNSLGPRFRPAAPLRQHAEHNTRFYP